MNIKNILKTIYEGTPLQLAESKQTTEWQYDMSKEKIMGKDGLDSIWSSYMSFLHIIHRYIIVGEEKGHADKNCAYIQIKPWHAACISYDIEWYYADHTLNQRTTP